MFLFGKKARLADINASLIAQSEEAVVAVGPDHEIALYNKGAEKLFGYSPAAVLGRPLSFLLPEGFKSIVKSVRDKLPVPEGQVLGHRADGSEFPAGVAVLTAGNHYAVLVRDVSRNKKTEEELLRLAATDHLTGVLNRREFTAIAEREAVRANRYNRPLSVLLIDIDHFKRLNDTYGHAAGDAALQAFAGLCCATLRSVDIFGRWGGEEFITLLPETNADGAMVIAERLRRLTSDSPVVFKDHSISYTVSVGISEFRLGEIAIDPPLSRADSAVYDAKKAGRNRIAVYRN